MILEQLNIINKYTNNVKNILNLKTYNKWLFKNNWYKLF